MHIRNYATAKMWFHVLDNPVMKNAEIMVFVCLNLLLNVTSQVALVCVYV